ncbi:hypothetical protein CISIN_1g017702mg [Citrus sinensis]|uniref:Uncharacterized protein n=2 Tax=Citrus TaxID=2706 RepID=A0A067DMM3_CITSI|nr:hypothetical protein CISIN_1g017702mg [Citrus sinensis]
MAHIESNNLTEAYPMVGGDDAYSYANNSTYQRGVVDAAKELISEAIADKLDLKILGFDDTLKPFKIADLGCSVGPNTLLAVQNIIEAIELKFQRTTNLHQKPSALEFQVFLNDHSDNDFNTLFKSLPHARKYFAAGLPGSFHSRLFPRSSIHFVHTSYALHWLSKVPKEIVDPCSPAWNKGSIQCSESNIEVVRAYSTQYKNDMESFLNARAEELVPGGLMVLILAAVVPDGIPLSNSYVGVFNNILGSCFNDLAKMGVLSEEKVDSFNLPTYNATPKELEAIIRTNGNFTIEKMEKLSQPRRRITANEYASGIRAGIDGLIKKHFGDEFVDEIFNYFTTKVEENYSIIEEKIRNVSNLFISLKRFA